MKLGFVSLALSHIKGLDAIYAVRFAPWRPGLQTPELRLRSWSEIAIDYVENKKQRRLHIARSATACLPRVEANKMKSGNRIDLLIHNGGVEYFHRDRSTAIALWIFVAVCILAAIAAAVLHCGCAPLMPLAPIVF